MNNNLLDVIREVLRKSDEPMTAEAILKKIESCGMYDFTGKTPKTVIRARLSESIDKQQCNSDFVRLQKGTYGLREWLNSKPLKYKEYETSKRKNQLMDEYLAVFNTDMVQQLIRKNGLNICPIDTSWLKSNCFPKLRREAEVDFSVIQLISVFLIRCGDRVITHTRSARAPETRLHGERSIIFGGHVTYEEINTLFDPFDPYSTHPFIERELEEEIKILHAREITPIGLLYDSTREVSSQHLGIVYTVEMSDDEYEIGEKGYHINDELTPIESVIIQKQDYENWSVELIEKIVKGWI